MLILQFKVDRMRIPYGVRGTIDEI